MERLKNLLSRVRLVYRRSSPLLKCVVAATLVVTIVALLVIRGAILEYQSRTDELRKEAAGLEAQNQQLEKDMGQQNTVEGILKIAKEMLGLVDPDSVILTPEQD